MEPKVVDAPVIPPENVIGSDTAEMIMGFLDKDKPLVSPAAKAPAVEPPKPAAPAPAPVAPKPSAAPAAAAPAAPKPDVLSDLVSAEALAAQAVRKEDQFPSDLLKDDEISKLPERKQREAFIKERAAHKEARTKMQELTQRIAELQAKADDGEQLLPLRKQLEEKDSELKRLSDEMARIDLSRSPEFKKRYDDRLNSLGGKMVQALVSEGVQPEEATELIKSLVGEQKLSVRESTLDSSAPSLKGTLLAFLSQFDEVAQERTLALEKSRETAAAIDEAERRGRLSAMAGKIDQVSDKAVQEAQARGSPYYKEVEGNDEWNAQVARRKQALKGLLLSMDPEKIAPFVAEGLTAADLLSRYGTLLKRQRELEQELADVIGQAPKLGQRMPGHVAAAPAPAAIDFGSGDIADAVTRML